MSDWVSIELRRRWRFDKHSKLGEGGLGQVFAGDDHGSTKVAIKRLFGHSDVGDKELANAEALRGKDYGYVMGVLDSGRHKRTGADYIVMPRAERNLEEELKLHGGKLVEPDAVQVLLDVVRGLGELSDLVHRDLKPRNLLRHEGRWKIADFGLAKEAEKATRPETVREWKSDEYAAPEQWRRERATGATDIYALGCIGYELLSGLPPFGGPNFQEQHCNEAPRPLVGVDPALDQLLSEMLSKVPDRRPSRSRVQETLVAFLEEPEIRKRRRKLSPLLAGAGAQVSAAQREAEAAAARANEEMRSRRSKAQHGSELLKRIAQNLVQDIGQVVPGATVSPGGAAEGGWLVWRAVLGQGVLRIRMPLERITFEQDSFHGSAWDVLLGGEVSVFQERPEYRWSASLWFTNRGLDDDYHWWEVGYMSNPLARMQPEWEPFAILEPHNAAQAHTTGLGMVQPAYEPCRVDGAEDDFSARWSTMLALASKGELEHPRMLPLDWAQFMRAYE